MVTKYSADAIHGDLYYTLQDDAEFVLASDYAALQSELARVKVESLRVVAVGESGSLAEIQSGECHLFRHVTGGPIYIIDTPVTGASTDSGHAHWCARIEGVVDEWSQYDDCAPVQPVRLERWEDDGCNKPHDKYAGKAPHDVRGWEPD